MKNIFVKVISIFNSKKENHKYNFFNKYQVTLIFSLVLAIFFTTKTKAQTPVDVITIDFVKATASSYTEGGVKHQWGEGHDHFLESIGIAGETYSYDSNLLPIRVDVIRVDAGHVSTGFRTRLMAQELDVDTEIGPTYPAATADGSRMEATLKEPIINRGALDVFHNVETPSSSQHANNIERIDILYKPITAPKAELLDEIGFLVSEKNGNNSFKIAVVKAVDPVTGAPSEYGELVTIKEGDYGEKNGKLNWLFLENAITPFQGNPERYSESHEQYGISYIAFDKLGVKPKDIIYGISVFGKDVTAVHDLTKPSTFPTNTSEGADIHGGLGSIVKTRNVVLITNPIAVDDANSTPQDVNLYSASGELLSNDSDPDGGTLSVTQFIIGATTYTIPANGSISATFTEGELVIQSDGDYKFAPTPGFFGNIPTAVYTISNGNGGTATAHLNIKVLLDTDGDGYVDMGDDIYATDLDDDNDGILDVIECPDAGSWVNWGPVDVTEADNTDIKGTIDGMNVTVTNDSDIRNPYIKITAVHGVFSGSFGMDDKAKDFDTNITLNMADSDGNITYKFNFDAPITRDLFVHFTALDRSIKLINARIITLINGTTDNGIEEFTKTGGVFNGGGFTARIPAGVSHFAFQPAAGGDNYMMSITSGCINTNNGDDGVPNYLDTDSDGDTCPDALEAAGAFVAVHIDGNERLIGGVDANGVPTVAGVGQATTAAVTDNTDTSACDADPIAVDDANSTPQDVNLYSASGELLSNDSDPDGGTLSVTQFSIGATTYTIPANGSISATFAEGELVIGSDGSYKFAPTAGFVGNIPTAVYTISNGNGGTATARLSIDVLPDADKDGVPNTVDLDDDNDGILDTDECSNQTRLVLWPNDPANFDKGTIKNNDIASAADQVYGTGLTDAPLGGSTHLFHNIDAATLNQAITNNEYIEYGLTMKADGMRLLNQIIFGRNQNSQTYSLGILISNDNFNTSTILTSQYNALSTTASGYQLHPVKITPYFLESGKSYQIRFYFFGNPNIIDFDDVKLDGCASKDGDIDGIPDSLDTDSDGDGCADAIEAAGIFTTADLDANGMLTGGVDNATGIPTVAGAGQATTAAVTDAGDASACGAPNPIAIDDANTTPQDVTLTVNVANGLLNNDSDPDGGSLSVTQFVIGSTTYTVPANGNVTANITEGVLTVNSDGSYIFVPTTGFVGNVPTAVYTISNGNGGTAIALLGIDVLSDTDKDGIPDTVDLDDDNDGILDDVECPNISATFTGGQTGTLTDGTASANYTITQNSSNGYSGQSYTASADGIKIKNNNTGGGSDSFEYNINITGVTPGYIPVIRLYQTINTAVGNSEASDFTISWTGGTGDAYYVDEATPNINMYSQGAAVGFDLDDRQIEGLSTTGNISNGSNLRVYNLFNNFAEWYVEFPLGSTDATVLKTGLLGAGTAVSPGNRLPGLGISGNIGETFNEWITFTVIFMPDTDNDGIVNCLDTDSDGDGCADAIEAAGIFTTADLDANGMLTGGVDNATGIPTVAGAGQATTEDVITDGPDADNDGVANACDEDDDNDGNWDEHDPHPLVPTTSPDSGSAFPSVATKINILDNDDFLDNLDLTNNVGTTTIVDAGTGNAQGTITFDTDTGELVYTPTLGELGTTVTVDYTVCNSNPDPDVCSTNTVTIKVGDGDNDKDGNPDSTDPNPLVPTTNPDVGLANPNVAETIDILGNDDFLDNDDTNNIGLTTIVDAGTGTAIGIIVFNADTGELVYTPTAGEVGKTVTVDYTVCNVDPDDATDPGVCSTNTVTITVGNPDTDMDGNPDSTDPNPNAPTTSPDTGSANPGVAATIDILGNDDYLDNLDGNNAGTTTIVDATTGTAAGTITFNTDTGELIYTPTTGEAGTDVTVDYTVCNSDTDPDTCSTNTVTITVGNPDTDQDGNPDSTDPHPTVPTTSPDTGVADVGIAVTIDILDNDDYLDNLDTNNVGTTTIVDAGTGNAQGTITFDTDTGELVYTPTAEEAGKTVTVDYMVCNTNPDPDVCATNTVTITVSDPDSDGDGVTDSQELADNTNPNDPCNYNVASQAIENVSDDWNAIDCDGDGVTNGTEILDVTDPQDMCDFVPESRTLDPSDAWNTGDCDNDGRTNKDEWDSDRDGNGPDDCDNDFIPDFLDPDVCRIVIPKLFTPNGDGVNDVFEIPNLAILHPNFEMKIFNRWGNIVYDYKNKGKSQPDWWDGFSTGRMTLNDGKRVPTGTYFYIINFKNGSKEPQSGWIYLNR